MQEESQEELRAKMEELRAEREAGVKGPEGTEVLEGKYTILQVESMAGNHPLDFMAELKDGSVEFLTAVTGKHSIDLTPFYDDPEISEGLLSFLHLVRIYEIDGKIPE